MLEGEGVGVEVYAPVVVDFGGAVFDVAAYGCAYFGELYSYLVGSAGVGLYGYEVVLVYGGIEVVVEYGFFAFGPGTVAGFGDVSGFVFFYPMGECAGKGVGAVVGDCPVSFGDFSFAEKRVHAGECLAGTGKDDDSAYRTIDAVDGAKKYIAGFVVTDFYVLLDVFGNGRIACAIALYEPTCGFIDCYKVVVFM